MHWESKKICGTHFIAIFSFLWWAGTESTVSPRCACIYIYMCIFMSTYKYMCVCVYIYI